MTFKPKRNNKFIHFKKIDIIFRVRETLSRYKKIRLELSAYDKNLSKKKEIIFFNKSDLLKKDEIQRKLNIIKKKINKKYETFSVFLQKDIQKIKKILIKNAN